MSQDGEVMRLFFLLSLISLSATAAAADAKKDPYLDAAVPTAPAAAPVADAKSLQGQVDPAMHKAVAEAMKADLPPLPYYQSPSAFGTTNSDIMTIAFNQAKKPDCLHAGGLNGQFTFFLTGYLALPFIPVAWLRGKCV